MDVRQKSQGCSSLFSINWWRDDAEQLYSFYLVYVQLADAKTPQQDKGSVRVYRCEVHKQELVLNELTHKYDPRNPDTVEDIYADAHAVVMNKQAHLALALMCRILTCDVNSVVTYDPEIPKQQGWKSVDIEGADCIQEWNRQTLRSSDYIFVRHPLLCELNFCVKDFIRAYIESSKQVSSSGDEMDIDCAPIDEDPKPLTKSVGSHVETDASTIDRKPCTPIPFVPKVESAIETETDVKMEEPEHQVEVEPTPDPLSQPMEPVIESEQVTTIAPVNEEQPKVEQPTAVLKTSKKKTVKKQEGEEGAEAEDDSKCPADIKHFESVQDLHLWAKTYVGMGLERDGWVPKPKKGAKKDESEPTVVPGEPLVFDDKTWVAWQCMSFLFPFLQKTKANSKSVDVIADIYALAKNLLPNTVELSVGVFILAGIYYGFASEKPRWKDTASIKFCVKRDSVSMALDNMAKTARGQPFFNK
uniref:Transmembrane protein n=1 Tax=Clandestinovirus TaxID=2831644 RepID=A0A8F8KTF8_9VIRU|nr:transmembrane protein [Clandestinovirus]